MKLPLTQQQQDDLDRITDETVQAWAFVKLLAGNYGDSADILKYLTHAAYFDSQEALRRHSAVVDAARQRMAERRTDKPSEDPAG